MLSKQCLPHKSTYIFFALLCSVILPSHKNDPTLEMRTSYNVHGMSVALCTDAINEMYENKRKLPSQRTHYRWSSMCIAKFYFLLVCADSWPVFFFGSSRFHVLETMKIFYYSSAQSMKRLKQTFEAMII